MLLTSDFLHLTSLLWVFPDIVVPVRTSAAARLILR